MYNNLLRASTHSSAAACVHCSTKSHANHSFQPCIFVVACQLSCTQSAALWYYSSASARVHLLNEQSHANHSFQLYIFDQLYSYHVTTAALRYYSSALLHVCC
jgi:hypothetical protein